MAATTNTPDATRDRIAVASEAARGFRMRCFAIEALNGLATSYYFNYLYFYLRDHFGFDNRHNLAVTAFHGFMYTFAAWNSGRFAQRHGYLFCLRLGFAGMCAAMVCGGLAPKLFGYTHTLLVAQFLVLPLWTFSMCLTWPTLQALLSLGQSPTAMPRTAGVYNVVWAGANAVAYLTGGALLERFGGETLFWLPAGLHLVQLLILVGVGSANGSKVRPHPGPGHEPQMDDRRPLTPALSPNGGEGEDMPLPLNPRPIAKARMYLYLAWLANPLAYMAINGILPVIPRLSASLGMDKAHAGLICSVWFWVRLAAFAWFWLWPGWHYRLRWLLGAYFAMAGSFTLMLLSTHVWMLVAAQVVFGLAAGLIYYSSLFYSMDVGEIKSKRGGIHEAAIGIGVFAGPAVGVTALTLAPGSVNAGTWAISTVLLLGLVPFLLIYRRGRQSLGP